MKPVPPIAAVLMLVLGFPAAHLLQAEEKKSPESVLAKKDESAPPTRFEKLTIRDGTEYLDCEVIRTEPDALVVRHRDGVARISFFHVSREIREAYQFDPFAALEHYENEQERQRKIRWMTFWDKERHEAKLAGEVEKQQLIKKAIAEWVPVEAKVVQKVEGGFLAHCQKVTFIKTQKRSTLGFLVDGPPKRKLVEFAGGRLIVLRLAAGDMPEPKGTWQGYVHPLPEKDLTYFYQGNKLSAPSYPAVGRK